MSIKFQKFDYLTQIKQQQELFRDCFPEVISLKQADSIINWDEAPIVSI
jgi:hypothetical protein